MAKYIPKNIKEGCSIDGVRECLTHYDLTNKKVWLYVVSYDHSRDMYGNGTAHYSASLIIESENELYGVCSVVSSGKRREQTGYGGYNEAALRALRLLGFEVERVSGGCGPYDSPEYYRILNL